MNNLNIQGTNYVGGITGHTTSNIINSETQGIITATGDYIGGIVGYTTQGVTSSNSNTKVKGRTNVGGAIRIHIFK
ncbi:hypothetical protein D3C72_1909950 [compost metagenome]